MAIATLTVDLVARLGDLQTGLDKASQLAEASARRMDSAFTAVRSAAGALGAGTLLLGFVGQVRASISAMDDLADAAQGLGVSASELSAFRISALSAGVSAEEFGSALNQLNRRIGEATGGSEQARAVFAALGVSIRDQAGQLRSTSDVLRDVSDRFASYRDGTLKSALAMETFGRSGAKLIAFLNEGREGLTKFGGASEEQIKSAARLQVQIDKLSAAWERLKLTTSGFVAGALVGVELPAAKEIEALEIRLKRLEENLANPRFRKNPELFERIRQEATATRAQIEGLRTAADDVKGAGGDDKPDAPVVKTLERISGAAAKARRELVLFRSANEGPAGEAEAREFAGRRTADDQSRLADLLGRTQTRKLEEDLARLDKAFFDGLVGVQEYGDAVGRVLGRGSETDQRIKETAEAADRLALTFASSIGQFIERGGDAGDFFKALLQDITKLVTQLVIVEPLARKLKEIFTSGGGSSGGNWWQALLSIFGGAASGGWNAGAGTAGGGSGTGPGGGASGFFVPMVSVRPSGADAPVSLTINIGTVGSGVSRADMVAAVEQASEVAIAKLQDRVARGRLQVA